MTTETHTVAMTDPQLANNNNNSSSNNNNNNNNNSNNNNNNNDGEPKYLHKKFKKMATTEVTPQVEPNKNDTVVSNGSPDAAAKRKESAKDPSESSKDLVKVEITAEPADGEPTESRKSGYVCPYCRLSCAKPSVLQKHIRAHTNERPYPCVPCGFAFKTKSNLYKHCRSRAHALKMEGGDASKVSEDSNISLSDSASNGTGTPPPPPSSTPTTTVVNVKTIKTGKIYKPKFHTALQCVNNDIETSSLSSTSSTNSSSSTTAATTPKPNPEQVQEHIDKIITDNQAIVDAVDPRLHKLIQKQQSLVELKQPADQPLNLSSAEESLRKRCYSESFAQDGKDPEGSIIKDLLLKSQGSSQEGTTESESYFCPSCSIPYSSVDNLDVHRRYYCKGSSSPRREYQLEVEKRDFDSKDFDSKSSEYYSTLQPLPSPGPLLGNTRLVDAYAPPAKKQRCESVPTTLRSLEELSKYPRPNSLQMFGGEVRILDNTGETKTMRIEPRQTNSPTSEQIVSSKCVTSETASIVVRSGLHSGGTMVHKPPSGAPASTPSPSISLPNTPKMLAPIIPNISTPNIAPSMSCYNYLEPNLKPLTSITAYNPLTLPQPGITNILHGGKVIPYVPGMPGPHTLTPPIDISTSLGSGEAGYKVIPGLPGLHIIPQPLDLASPVKIQTPTVPGIPGPMSSGHVSAIDQPLDLASPAKDSKLGFRTPGNEALKMGLTSPKVPSVKNESSTDKYRRASTGEMTKAELDRHIKNSVAVKYKSMESPKERRDFSYDRSPKVEKSFGYSNGIDASSYNKLRYSPKESPESRKRLSTWSVNELESGRASVVPLASHNSVPKYDSSPPLENGRLKGLASLGDARKPAEYYGTLNGAKTKADSVTSMVIVNVDSTSKTEAPSKPSVDSTKTDKGETKSPKSGENATMEETSSNKFLRPTSLPLKPGTFTPKKHHGITPTANTLPLISPETPRPKKSYGQLYLNGHAYTYLGLKCSTRVFYCTLNRPQPMYVTQQHGLSMYSNWEICKEAPPDVDMAHYDSRHRPVNYTTAWKKQEDILTHSSERPTTPSSSDSDFESDTPEKGKRGGKVFDGGFESGEDYTYVRGKGRARYVCEECGIRCKKSSMLKKHIRTHAEARSYTSKHCAYSVPVLPQSPLPSSNSVEVRQSNVEMRQSNVDNRPPSRDMSLLSEYRQHHAQSQEPRANLEAMSLTMHEPTKIHEISRSQSAEVRNADRVDMKHTEMTKQSIAETIKHTVARKMVVGGPGFRSPSPNTAISKPQAEFLQPSNGPAPNYVSYSVTEDGKSVCGICNKVFSKPSQLRLHINIHYFERPFRCESCAVSFRTKGHLTKHERSVSHHNKVSMTSTFGAATTSNPRPFKCTDCKIAFRIHGHLAKHLRSKMHIMKLECLGKLPFGTYAEMERSGVNLNDIDTTDCDNSLSSLQMLAQRLCEKDPTKIGQWDSETIPSQVISGGETSSDEGEPIPQHA
ncbi:transcription factor HIVEP3-like [Frieseomelitta varia]|uniref:transcription factor HIVEP3-like n=1 Tax=Frieseomelitta varia TaxID=561572 RepID=UPI001CB699AF|nr:transcription factor HIVEP3-like [Frieseomelitta varia]